MSRLSDPFTWAAELIDKGYSAQQALRQVSGSGPVKWISYFGASPSNPDNTDAFSDAVEWLNDQTNPPCLMFEAGIYKYTVSPNWAVENAVLHTCGVVRLRYSGTGNAMIFDGGASVFAMRIGRFFIEAPATAGHGVTWEAMHHCTADFNVRGCGATKAGLYMGWSVVNELRVTVSKNEGGLGWYDSAKPKHGIYMDTDGVNGPPAWNNFPNPILEATDIGCEIASGYGNSFYTGTMEGCTTYGLKIGTRAAGCLHNKLFGTDFESNGTADIECAGYANDFHSVDTLDIRFLSGASNNRIFGGAHKDIDFASGAVSNVLSGFTIDRNGNIPPGEVTGDLDANLVRDMTDNSNNATPFIGLTTPLYLPPLVTYDAEPARASETNLHGGLLSLATASALNSGTPINIAKGIGKILVVFNAGSDFTGTFTVTGVAVDRDTGDQTSPSFTEDVITDTLSTDTSSTDGNGNTVHGFSNAYITSSWFVGACAISTTDLTLTDVDVYHVSFEQFNDADGYTLDTLDVNLFTTNANAEFDCYLYSLIVTGSKCVINNEAHVHVGTNQIVALANRYERLRRGNIGTVMDGSSDGIWVDVFYANSPTYVEDVTIKVWATTDSSF